MRYYCISRVLAAEAEEAARSGEGELDYDEFIHGGEPTAAYLNFRGY